MPRVPAVLKRRRKIRKHQHPILQHRQERGAEDLELGPRLWNLGLTFETNDRGSSRTQLIEIVPEQGVTMCGLAGTGDQ